MSPRFLFVSFLHVTFSNRPKDEYGASIDILVSHRLQNQEMLILKALSSNNSFRSGKVYQVRAVFYGVALPFPQYQRLALIGVLVTVTNPFHFAHEVMDHAYHTNSDPNRSSTAYKKKLRGAPLKKGENYRY